MTDSEIRLVAEWIDKNMNHYCQRLSAWMSTERCEERQIRYGTKLKITSSESSEYMPNPKIVSCVGCEHFKRELRHTTMNDRKIHYGANVILNIE